MPLTIKGGKAMKNVKKDRGIKKGRHVASGAPQRKRVKVRGVGAATKGLMFYES